MESDRYAGFLIAIAHLMTLMLVLGMGAFLCLIYKKTRKMVRKSRKMVRRCRDAYRL
jgi:predicted exporter